MKLRNEFKQRMSKLPKRVVVPVAVAVVLIGSIVALDLTGAAPITEVIGGNSGQSAADYKKTLQGQVDTDSGAPQSGRDPATQQQTSLASVANKPSGVGRATDSPASGVSGSTGTAVDPESVYNSKTQQSSGINAAGCFYDYGIPGQQCVAASLAGSDGILSCSEVHTQFKDGMKVNGTDRFGLDTNGDKVACSAGDSDAHAGH